MKFFYFFIGFLVLLFVGTVLGSIFIDAWRKYLATEFSKMTEDEIESRLTVLFYELDERWSFKKKLEYEALLDQYRKRKKM